MAKKCNHCETRTAHHPEKLKSEIAKRLNRIEGQVRGVKKMVEEDVYCDGVLNQITSMQSALNGVRMLLLENHIKSCVVDQLTEGKREVIGELMATITRMTKS
jgi:CsoR family transcriptional regulator, copper-sensing transcriptional repressor